MGLAGLAPADVVMPFTGEHEVLEREEAVAGSFRTSLSSPSAGVT
jgi:hypothetical protein